MERQKPINQNRMETAMQDLKDKIIHAEEELKGDLTDYERGYKQCLINVQNDINLQMLELEKEQRKNDFRAGWHGNNHKDLNCEFYVEKYISNDFKTK